MTDLMKTYELISELEEKEPVFGLQERLFLTQAGFHAEDMEMVTALANQMASEKWELTTGCIDPELKKILDPIEEKGMEEAGSFWTECMDLQERIKASIIHIEDLYQRTMKQQESSRPHSIHKSTLINIGQAFDSEMKEIQSYLEGAYQAWEHFMSCENHLQAVRQLERAPDSLKSQEQIQQMAIRNQLH